uniref:Mitotic spindle positioning n=1 Tax=Chelydra serpentina TaxID=8475 RepID=A0A8C3T879_CHESE
MDRVTRNLIFHIPHTTPEYNTHQSNSFAELRTESDHDVFAPYSQRNQKAENGHDWGPSYLPEDRSELATNSLEARRDLWTPSPDRESKLELVKSGTLYDVRAYKEERKPSKLYMDDEEELNYPLTRLDISPEKAKELEEERKEVIQSQVVRRSSTMAKQGGGYATSFALCFDSPSPAQVRTPIDPESIDREQINFAAARQQFLTLEKTNPSSLFSPRQHTSMAEELYAPKKVGMEREEPNGRMVFDTQLDLKAGSQDPAKELKARDETPIEREIRLAMEREASLRKERGIQRLNSSNELVEIQTKPLLSTSLSLSSSRKVKDKGRVSFFVQREIEQETKREEDLKKEGRLLGMYDKGTQQELEQAVDGSFGPTESTTDGKRVPNHNVNLISFQAYQPYSTLNTSKRSTVDELLSCNQPSGSCSKSAGEDSFGAGLLIPTERADSTPSPEERVRVHKEYFATPFWKPKISFVSDQGTQGLLGKEKMLEPAGAQEDQYTLKKCKSQTSWLIEEDIRSALQREQELQEQRRHRLLTDSFSPANDHSSAREKGFRSQLSSQTASGTADSYWVTESPVFVPASHQSGAPGSASPPNVPSPYQGYTGRHASETILESTRVTRHKNAMAKRWESGQFFNKDND